MIIDKDTVIFEKQATHVRKVSIKKDKFGGSLPTQDKVEWKTINCYVEGDYIVLIQKSTQQEVG